MTIQIVVKNTNGEGDQRKATVFTSDNNGDGNVLSTLIADLGPGEEVMTYITDTRSVEIRET